MPSAQVAEPAVRGTQGYGEQAAALIERYESLPFTYKHEEVLHLLPMQPTAALDVGAGTGADAAWLAQQGRQVLAVEPTEAFRQFGIAKYAHSSIEWLNDSLPQLEKVVSRGQTFGLIMLTAVWMHLDREERASAMPVLASLLAPRGVLVMALRHGPVPSERVMFAVPAEETVGLAVASGLGCVFEANTESRQVANREAGVTWSRLVFSRA